ncbi:MAG TPA: hypothetical protein VGJ07_06865 [Rugosimonospora sp.]
MRASWSVIPRAGWALLAGAFLASQVSTYLNRALWISDSRLYLAWAYRYLGYSDTAAAHRTAAHLRGRYGLTTCGFCWPPGYEHSFFHGDNGAVVGPRVLYPLLSAPFVGLFGPNGMLVVPVLSYGVGAALLAILAARLWGRWWGVAAGAMVLLPPLPSRFGLYALTDATALMFTVAGMLCLPLARRARRRDLLWFAILLELGLFTRQFAVTITAGILLTWLMVAIRDRRVRNPWLSFAVVSAVLTVASLAVQNVVASHLYGGDSLSLTQRYQRVTERVFNTDGFAAVPKVLRNMLHVDYRYVRAFDLLLIVIVVFALISAFWRFRSELSIMLIGMSASTLALAILIVDPTYFRYFVPVVPLMVLCVLALIADLTSARGTRPSRSTEAVGEAALSPEDLAGAPAAAASGSEAPGEAQPGTGHEAQPDTRQAQRDTRPETQPGIRHEAQPDTQHMQRDTRPEPEPDTERDAQREPGRDRQHEPGREPSPDPLREPRRDLQHDRQREPRRDRQRWRERITCARWRQRIAGAGWGRRLARVAALPPAGWGLLAVMYLIVIYVTIARSSHQHGYKIPALAAFTVAVPAIVALAARRGGAVAGALAGIGLILSASVVSMSISASRSALALLAIIGCLAMLPGGWGGLPRAASLTGFAVLLAVALAVQYRSIIVVVGVLVACPVAVWRGRAAAWLPYGLIALVLGAGSVLADLWVAGRRAQYPHSWFWNSTGWFGRVIGHLARPELTQITGDRIFLACCVLTLAALLLRRGQEWSWMAAGTLAAGLVLVVFSNRADHLYYLSLAFPALVLVAVDLVVSLTTHPPATTAADRGPVASPGGRRVARKKMRTARVSV